MKFHVIVTAMEADTPFSSRREAFNVTDEHNPKEQASLLLWEAMERLEAIAGVSPTGFRVERIKRLDELPVEEYGVDY